MTYADLTVHQKIGLKGAFTNDPTWSSYGAIMLLWNFKVAIEYFLKDDPLEGINHLYATMAEPY